MWLIPRKSQSLNGLRDPKKNRLNSQKSFTQTSELIVGWRAWAITKSPVGVFLRSAVQNTHWPHRKRMVGSHHGIYAYKNAGDGLSYFTDATHVFGSAYLWGIVCEHEFGYKAQFAYPKELWVSGKTDPTVIIGLEEAYGIPVKESEDLKPKASSLQGGNPPSLANAIYLQKLGSMDYPIALGGINSLINGCGRP